jgi:hypothetical protein
MWRIRRANNIPTYIEQDVKLHSLFISGNCSTCFECYIHPSLGAHTTVSTASGILQTVTATCRYCGRVGTGLSVLWVAYACVFGLKNVVYLNRTRRSVERIGNKLLKYLYSEAFWNKCWVEEQKEKESRFGGMLIRTKVKWAGFPESAVFIVTLT